MKFTLERALFQQNLAKIQGITERRSTLPILSNLLISGAEDTIELVATDLEIGVKEKIEATLLGQGSVCVSGKKLYDIVRELPGNRVEVEREENFWISIKGGRSTFNLPGLDPDDFPAFPSTESANYFSIGIAEFLEMIERTVFAAATEESRLNLNGIYMEKAGDAGREVLRMVATDGHRLARVDKAVETKVERGVILPRRGVMELRKVLTDGDNEVAIAVQENNCIFKTKNTEVVVRLLEGEYPDYHQVIPSGNDKRIIVDRKEFIGAVRRAQVIASEQGEGVRFHISSGQMEVKTGGPSVGNVHEEVKIDYEGEAASINFNGRYLLDVLNTLDTDTVTMEVKEELTASVIKPADGEECLYVIMPMRL